MRVWEYESMGVWEGGREGGRGKIKFINSQWSTHKTVLLFGVFDGWLSHPNYSVIM